MALGKRLLLALALATATSAVPTGKPAKDLVPEHGMVKIYDAKVAEPTQVVKPIVWKDKAGKPVATVSEKVQMLPMSMYSVTKTTLTSSVTETVVVAKGAATAMATNKPDGPAGSGKPSGLDPSIDGEGVVEVDDLPTANSSLTDSGDPTLFGVSYAPYCSNHQCSSADHVAGDIEKLGGKYSVVRTYGTDCDQVSKMYKAAKPHDIKLFLGIWDINQVQSEAQQIIDGIQGDWAQVHTISVGNELVNKGQATPSQVVTAVRTARQMLRSAGYNGPVVTVDTFNAAEEYPELCEESDYCAVNAHAFFDSTTSADQAGSWLENTVSRLQSKLPSDKRIVVTETGWPTRGETNGMAVPGIENQKMAIGSIRTAFASKPNDVILFSAYDDLWKAKSMDTFNAEPYWGLGGALSTCDQ